MAHHQDVLTLHRYFVWANRLKTQFDQVLASGPPPHDPATWLAHDLGVFMSYWYASLFVVVEGWRELRFQDPAIDSLLESPNVDHLRRYRHGVCHFQKAYFDSRFLELAASADSAGWVRELNEQFGRWFLHELAEHGTAGQ